MQRRRQNTCSQCQGMAWTHYICENFCAENAEVGSGGMLPLNIFEFLSLQVGSEAILGHTVEVLLI